jgi:hypothetical protein
MVRNEKNAKLWAGRGGHGGITDPSEGLVVGLWGGKAKVANRRDCVGDGEKVIHGGGLASPATKGAIGDLDLWRWRRGVGQSQAETEEYSKKLQDAAVAHGQNDDLVRFNVPCFDSKKNMW